VIPIDRGNFINRADVEEKRSVSWSRACVCMCMCVCMCICVKIQLSWEDKRRGW